MAIRQFYMSEMQTRAVEELCFVALKRAVTVEGAQALQAGSVGTVVAVLKESVAYIVEFTEPFEALVDVEIGDFEVLSTAHDDDRMAGRLGHRAS